MVVETFQNLYRVATRRCYTRMSYKKIALKFLLCGNFFKATRHYCILTKTLVVRERDSFGVILGWNSANFGLLAVFYSSKNNGSRNRTKKFVNITIKKLSKSAVSVSVGI